MKPFSKTLLSAGAAAMLSTSALTAQAVTDEEFNQLKSQFDQLAEAMESSQTNQSSSKTTLGGYGELHYNNLSNGTKPQKKEIDFHRFVLFVGHEFSDRIRFFSELELEHSLSADKNGCSFEVPPGGLNPGDSVNCEGSTVPGAVAIEQAYVDIDLTDNTSIKAGVLLIPVGMINETHEPPRFYGVERNPINKHIIPTTWREGGFMYSGHTDAGFSYDIAVTSGLKMDPGKVSIRGGRQKASEAKMNNPAVTGRVKYTGISGLTLAAAIQVNDDATQDSSDNVGRATLTESHLVWNTGALTLKALYARWNIDGVGATALNKDSQYGGYVEAGYKLSDSFGVFSRYNAWDNGGSGDTKITQTDVGFSYWPHQDVVVKVDYQAQTAANNSDSDGFNVGVGYQF